MLKLAGLLAVLALVLSGCGGGRATQPLDLSPHMSGSTLTLLRYDNSNAALKIRGQISGEVVTGLTGLTFHAVSNCTDNPIGSGIVNEFSSSGIQIVVPSAVQTSIYARTNTDNGCYYLVDYAPPVGLPLPPAFSSSVPASPSRVSYQPTIVGTTGGSIATVSLFDDVACAHQVGSGSASDFANVGIGTTLTPNTTSTIYGQAIEPLGAKSNCTFLTSYTHDSTLAPAPVLASMNPASPSRTALTTVLTGTVDPSVTNVTLYSDAACSQQIATGTAAAWTGTGFSVTVLQDTTNPIYAQSIDAQNRLSACTYLDTFINDETPPAAPAFANVLPGNPTRLTFFPNIVGTASADTVTVKLFGNSTCTTEIGSGSRATFTGAGIVATARQNATTSIYAIAYDQAANPSPCTQMVDFVNNTIPPDQPQFVATNPASPNNLSTTPYVIGIASASTAIVNFFDDAICTHSIGTGNATDFISTGVQVTVQANATTSIFAQTVDAIGNTSDCTLLTDYAHSTIAAPAPVYVRALPVSPSRLSLTPNVQGTSGSNVVDIKLFSDVTCATKIGEGRKSDFEGSGVTASVNANSTTPIYATATDIYGNISTCTFMTNFTHDNIAPTVPAFANVVPATPNRTSQTPNIIGTASADTATVALYDSNTCSSQIGTGTRADFVGTGVVATVALNSSTDIYAKAFDQAGNGTACTFMTNYVYDKLPPGQPNLTSASPTSPSYTNHVTFKGTLAASTDFESTTAVTLYIDSLCTSTLVSGTPSQWTSGLTVDVPLNQITHVYGQSVDAVGNLSPCNHLIDYNHNNAGPTQLLAFVADNGSISLSWASDPNATSYIVKRSTTSGGPYTIINPANFGSAFTDTLISDNTTYYYVIASQNVTGISLNSSEISVPVSLGAPPAPTSLTATASSGAVNLVWGGSTYDNVYYVYRANQSGGPYTLINNTTPSGAYSDMGLTNNVTYYYVVRSSNAHGLSGYSNEARAVPKSVPPAPTNLKGRYIPGTGYELTWSAPSYYTAFKIKRGQDTSTLSTYATVSGNTFTYVDTSPSYNGSWNYNVYVVDAVFGSAVSGDSNVVGFSYTPGTTAMAAAGDGQVVVQWIPVTGASDYVVYKSKTPGGPYSTLVSGVTGSSYTDTGVTNGTTYYYVVMYRTSVADGEWSNEVSAIPSSMATDAPTNLVVINSSSNRPVFYWTAPGKYDWFNIYRATSSSGPWVQLNGSPVTAPTYTDSTVPAGDFYYRVTAVWGSAETGASNSVNYRNGTTASLNVTSSATNISLSWPAISGSNGYNIYRSTDYNGPYMLAASGISGTTYVDASAAADQGYYYKVAATFADGTLGQLSNYGSGQYGTNKAPSSVSLVAATGSSVTLRWNKAFGTSTFKIYRGSASGGPYALKDTQAATADTVTGLSSYQKQYYVVTSVTSGVESSTSNELSVVTASPMSAPIVTPGSNTVALSWFSSFGADSYTLLRSTDAVNFSPLATGLISTLYNDNTAVNGTQYFYEVYPVYLGVSTYQVSAMSQGVTPGIVPATPGNISLISNNDGTDIGVEWGIVNGATSYNLYTASSSAGPYTFYQNVAGPIGNTITGLTAGTPIYVEVSALRGTIESPLSSPLGVVPMTLPSAPSATIVSNNSVLVTWATMYCSSGVPATSYDVLRASNEFDFQTIATGLTGTSYSDTSYTSGISYEYEVTAYCGSHILGSTSVASSPHVTPGVAPVAPQGLVVYSMTTNSAVLSWVDVPTAVSYKIYRSTVSGGPYTLVNSSAISGYTNSGLSAGTYYYVVSAIGPTGMESAMSTEGSITLSLPAPTGLTASNGVGSTSESWSAVGGASSYSVYRSVSSGGPYGLIASGLAGLTYTDSTATAGSTYYYVVSAVGSNGAPSAYSNQASAVSSAALNLQVPIEMVDSPIGSNTTATTFARTQTSLDPTAYDGTVSYEFEVVAANAGVSSAQVKLVDPSNVTYATVTVPAGTTTPTRLRVSMTPNASRTIYRVQTPAVATVNDVTVTTARMIVTQVGATKTKLYIPLVSMNGIAVANDATAAATVNATTYASLVASAMYKRQTTKLAQLNDYNAWELEAVAAANGGATGAIALVDTTTGSAVKVDDTETLVTQSTPTLFSVPIDDGVNNFASANENDTYEISARCYQTCSGGSVGLYHAGLWVSLNNISKVQVYMRVALGADMIMSPTPLIEARTLWDSSKFSNPTTYFQSSGASPTTGYIELNKSSLETGSSDLTFVSGSGIYFSGTTKTLTRQTVTVTTGSRLAPDVDPQTSPLSLNSSFFIIEAH